jgi:hypothetical protein
MYPLDAEKQIPDGGLETKRQIFVVCAIRKKGIFAGPGRSGWSASPKDRREADIGYKLPILTHTAEASGRLCLDLSLNISRHTRFYRNQTILLVLS